MAAVISVFDLSVRFGNDMGNTRNFSSYRMPNFFRGCLMTHFRKRFGMSIFVLAGISLIGRKRGGSLQGKHFKCSHAVRVFSLPIMRHMRRFFVLPLHYMLYPDIVDMGYHNGA